MLNELIIGLATAAVVYKLYKLITSHHNYFKNRNVKALHHNFILGNTAAVFLNRQTTIEHNKELYNNFPEESIYGIFDFCEPQFVIRDPELFKRITTKDFEYFENHFDFTDAKTDKIWGNTLFFMKGQRWRHMRATVSPVFTGSKMRSMFNFKSEYANNVVKHFVKRAEKPLTGQKININILEFFHRYSADVTAASAFGLKVDSFADSDNEFISYDRGFDNLINLNVFKTILLYKFRWLARIFKIQHTSRETSAKFRKLILDTMDERKMSNVHRQDLINIMTQVREGTIKRQFEDSAPESFAVVAESEVGRATVDHKFEDDALVAQCFTFYTSSIKTTASTLTFLAYELMVNQDVQQKLYEEIEEVNEQLDGKPVTYDSIQRMKYLDQVVCEGLRKWPPVNQLDRVCTKNYTFVTENGKQVTIEKGTRCIFPFIGLHHDPKYYEDPDRFDPERFSDENKKNIAAGTYLSFGYGPRSCIGSRLAIMITKVILYHLLLNFSMEPNERTVIPIRLRKTWAKLKLEKDLEFDFVLRKK